MSTGHGRIEVLSVVPDRPREVDKTGESGGDATCVDSAESILNRKDFVGAGIDTEGGEARATVEGDFNVSPPLVSW